MSVVIVLIAAEIFGTLSAADIERFIDAHRFEGAVAGYIDAEVRGDLNADTVADLVIVYSYSTTQPTGSTKSQYLVAFLSGATGHIATEPLLVGGRYDRIIEELTLEQGGIRLKSSKWLAGDPACCPSGGAKALFQLEDERLVEVEGVWWRRE